MYRLILNYPNIEATKIISYQQIVEMQQIETQCVPTHTQSKKRKEEEGEETQHVQQ